MGFRVVTAICQEKQENHPYSMQRQNAESRLAELTQKAGSKPRFKAWLGTRWCSAPCFKEQTPVNFDVLFWFGFGFWCLSSHRKEGLGFRVSQPEVWNNNNYLDTTFPTFAPAPWFWAQKGRLSSVIYESPCCKKAATAMKNSWTVHQPPSCGCLCWEM